MNDQTIHCIETATINGMFNNSEGGCSCFQDIVHLASEGVTLTLFKSPKSDQNQFSPYNIST